MADWRKSSYSDASGGQCIEVGTAIAAVLVRDTTDRDGCTLSVPPAAWTRFLAALLRPGITVTGNDREARRYMDWRKSS
jgi:hypothetical protein